MAFITDPISDMIVRIKNAAQRKHKQVLMDYSSKKAKILEIIKAEGYITEVETVKPEGVKHPQLAVTLKYKGNTSVISGIKRVSKPGLRVYVQASEVPSVLSGYGVAIISTSNGLLTDKQARKANVGGEVIAYI